MPIGNTDFARDFQIGASVARMAQQRQERMIELRAQAALQQLQERQIAQEMDIKAQNFMRQQKDDQYIRAKFAAADEMHATLAPEIGSDAAKEFIDNALSYDPIAGPVLMKAREAESQMRMNQAHAKAYEADAKASATTFNANLKPIPIKDEKGNIISYAVQSGPKTTHFITPEKEEIPPADVRTAKYLADLKGKLAEENQGLLESGVGENDPDTTQRRNRIAKLQNEITALEPKKNQSVLNTKMELLQKVNDAVETAAQTGDPDALAAAIAERDQTEALVYPKGTKLQGINPITGKSEPRVAGGTTAAQDEITAKVRSDLQTQINSRTQAAKSLHDMEQAVDWSTVGPVAWMMEKAGRYGPGSIVGMAGKKSAGKRAEIKGATMDIMNELEVKGHASKAVIDEIKKTLPSTGFFENPDAARTAIQERKRSFIVDGLTSARQLGIKPPPELMQLLSTYPTKELQRMASTGIISVEDAQAAFALQMQAHPNNPNVTPTPKWAQ